MTINIIKRLISPLLYFCFPFLISVSFSVSASSSFVEALQMPAWLERNGKVIAVSPGIKLQQGDFISTGKNARLFMRMEEGSLIKLGENAKLVFNTLLPAEEEQGYFEAALKVVQGAFRFTTSSLGKYKKRNINIQIGAIAADVIGTDMWGSSRSNTDILCLIEGTITAQRAGEPEFDMQDPLSFYLVPKNKQAQAVTPVTEEQLLIWSNETELQSGLGILSTNGQWGVNLISSRSRTSVESIGKLLAQDGFASKIKTAVVKGNNWYRLTVNGFNSKKDALAFAKIMHGRNGLSQPWVRKITN